MNKPLIPCRVGGLALILCCWAGAPEASAGHPFHNSVAEMEWNEETGCLEVALKLWAEDLERILQSGGDRRLSLDDDDPQVDQAIVSYLQPRFRVTDTAGDEAPIEWVGKEVTLQTAWLYFEMPLAESAEGIAITNRLLFESFDDQTNLVHYRHQGRRLTLTFRAGQSEHRLKLNMSDRSSHDDAARDSFGDM